MALSKARLQLDPVDGKLLEVDDLHVEFRTRDGIAKAINGVNFSLRERETLAILGESGSGKSVTAQAIMGILDTPPAHITGGSITYCGMELLTAPARTMQDIRGEHIAMIFQDALSALNPVFPVGWQIAEMFRQHRRMNRSDSLEQAVRLMERVRIPAARQRAGNYPHQFSGGMRQRIMIAMAIALNPRVLIADEPTTALDVVARAEILGLLSSLTSLPQAPALLLITHDLPAAAICENIAVLHDGAIIESGQTRSVLTRPEHPVTAAMCEAGAEETIDGALAAAGAAA